MLKKKRGTTLITVTIAMSILILISGSLMTGIVNKTRYQYSQENVWKSYYLAESGLNEAISYLVDEDIDTSNDGPGNACSGPAKNKNPNCKDSNKNKDEKSNKGKGNESNGGPGNACSGPAKDKNPHCKEDDKEDNNNEDYSEYLNNPDNEYELIFEDEILKPFQNLYNKEHTYSFKGDKIKDTNIYRITTSGSYLKAKTEIEAFVLLTEESEIIILDIKEK